MTHKPYCSIANCERPAKTRGMCGMHAERARSGADLLAPPYRDSRPFEERYEVSESGCWVWTGALASEGYGKFRGSYAHRLSYERAIGAIPAGLQIDHLCRNRACINPSHLEAVTQRENILRGNSPSAIAARSTRCKRDLHDLSPENTIITERGYRYCRACRRATQAAYNKRRA